MSIYEGVATIVALAALISAIANTVFQFHHNRLSVRPLPDISTILHDECFAISLENVGHGPMKIQDIQLRGKNGEVLEEGGCNQYFDSLISDNGESKFNRVINTLTMKREATILLYEFSPAQRWRSRPQYFSGIQDLKIFIRYRDLYDNIYSVTLPVPYEDT